MSDGNMPDRVNTLQTLSGLVVTHRREKNENVFEFLTPQGRSIKTCFTYDKAKLFAEGIKLGREMAS